MAADVRLVRRASTRVMSCDATIIARGCTPECVEGAVRRLHQLEQRWSRFLPTSEVSSLNHADGRPRIVSADTIRLVVALVHGWHATEGAFDPTLLAPLVGLGYAASRDDQTRRTSLPHNSAERGRPDRIEVDQSSRCVSLPRGTVLDAGGMGKGLAADIVSDELVAAGASGALVEIGGDLRVAGEGPDGGAWTIAVPSLARPDDEHPTIRLAGGGVATSTTRLRTWRSGHRTRHHLIDPDRRRPTTGDVETCTVVAGTGAWAEAFTKIAFVRGLDDARAAWERHGLAAAVVTADGARHTTRAWNEYER